MATITDNPTANQILKNSQPLIRDNIQYVVGALGKDHQIVFGHTDATLFEGRHLQVSLKNQNGTVYTISDGDDQVLYSDNGVLKSYSSLAGNPTFQITPCLPLLAQVTYVPSTTTTRSSYNVASVARTGGGQPAGDFTISFTTPSIHNPAQYAYFASFTTGATGVSRAVPFSIAPGSIRVQFNNNSNGYVDPETFSIIIFGD